MKIYTRVIIYLIAFTWFIPRYSHAQGETNHWFFGVLAGLDFSSGTAVAEGGGQTVTNEGTACISDPAGNLLFYTDGITVWNSNHEIMPNGTGLGGGISSTQSALIVPDPASNFKYYVFTTDEIGGPNGFQYSVVDMSLQSGLGDVTIKDSVIQEGVTEKLAAVRSAHKGDFWIAVHDWSSDTFNVYSLSVNGLSPTPVISTTGVVYTTAQIQNTYGQLKFSPCGDKLATAAGYLDTLDIFDFDLETGVVSNHIGLPMPGHVYGVEFSPSEQYIYVTCYYYGFSIIQFDITAGNASDILASEIVINSTPDLYALQLGLDGKIYVCKSFSAYLDVVDKPDLSGPNSDYISNAVNLDPNYQGVTSALGLPNFVSSFLASGNCFAVSNDDGILPKGISVSPNPTSDQFTLTIPEKYSSVEIFNVEGKRMQRFSSDEATLKFGEKYPPGIYLVEVRSESGNSQMKIVKAD